tara:strand:- start:332 stop:1294 length:963 start_codon:yes stop_codon:yes gene_type:complete
MKPKEILVFGASGQIGRHLIRKFTKNNYKVIAVTRNIHQKGYVLKTQANPGYLEMVELKSFNYDNIKHLLQNCEKVINLVGILFEKKNNEFNKIHTIFPHMLSEISRNNKIQQFVHVSSLGIDDAKDSKYAISKFEGEKRVRENFEKAVILKPSIVYSVDDNFTTRFMALLNQTPIVPLYYGGRTKFAPIHVSDFSNIIFNIVDQNIQNLTLECIGPEILSFKDIIKQLLNSINKKRLLVPFSLSLAKLSAAILQMLPNPLLTKDQLKLLKYDNIPSGKFQTNIDLGFEANKKFKNEIEKYSFNWRTGGQFSKNINSSTS